jgi:hypothetical protein
MEELHDYCKTLFNDFKLIDLIVGFSIKKEIDKEEEVDEERVEKMNEITNKLPLICSKDRNISTSI